MKAKELISLTLILFSFLANDAYAAQKSLPIAGDQRIRTYNFQPDSVYEYTGYLKVASRIDLDPEESVVSITMGDPTGWQINPTGSTIFIKPIEIDATTNMTIITDKRTYYFELYSKEAASIDEPGLSFTTSFNYSDTEEGDGNSGFMDFGTAEDQSNYVPDPVRDAPMLNFNYTMSGSKDVAPLEVFDDGEFTYFKFKDINADYPAIFQVLPDGNEALINFRISKEGYVVVEMVTSQYTLRFGNQMVCVFNEKMPLERTSKKDDNTSFFGIF